MQPPSLRHFVPQGGRGSSVVMPEQVIPHYRNRGSTAAGAKAGIARTLEERDGN